MSDEAESVVETVPDALTRQIARVAALRALYLAIPAGGLAAGMMSVSLARAHEAIATGDVVAQVRALRELGGYAQ